MPTLRRLGFWAAVGAVFLALSWLVLPRVSSGQPAPAPAHTAATAAPTIQATPPAPIPKVCLSPAPEHAKSPQKPLWEKLVPIAILLLFISLVIARLPRAELGHSLAFRRRRLLNWLPLGLTYSFLYMGRYNLNQFLHVHQITESQYGTIFGVGSAVYGLSFLVNGPLTDRLGGRATILIAAAGSAVCNALIGYMVLSGTTFGLDRTTALCVFYGANMYFQSFGAVSIVKVNAAWFHLRERGTFGGIFGILISLGLFFAIDGGTLITDYVKVEWLFFIPALILAVFFVLSFVFVRNTPSDTGHPDFDLGDATRDHGVETAIAVLWRVISHPVIFTIAIIELCSGFLRQAIFQWSREFGSGVGLHSFVFDNWGMVSCIAGITGGMFAGAISDHVFGSRRLPVSAVLYSIMLACAIAIIPMLAFGLPVIPWIAAVMSMAVIGVHGMLSGTASADFGGRKNTGVAVGIIDGFVYAGSMIQSFLYGAYLPAAKIGCPDHTSRSNPAAAVAANWRIWPYAMIPVALLGLALAVKLWNARADGKK